MAKCELGYLCEVCGAEVEDITQSDLYLRFVLGEVEARYLMTAKERHLRCNPVAAQFIIDPGFTKTKSAASGIIAPPAPALPST